jgi:ubiquinone/menaquinone biosynthesis C-methylase UbiE/uncharacterized protein YbaR (Trm112 family)
MLSKILPTLRCPDCSNSELQIGVKELICPACKTRYPLKNGILDMMKDSAHEVITPFQRLMQSRSIVSIYENFWRRIGYFMASNRSFNQEMETILQLSKDRSVKLVLDLASGTGIFTRPLARQDDRWAVGVDMSRAMLLHAQRRVQKEGIQNVLYIRATAFNLPFKDASIPYVNCCGALHLFDRPEVALKEIARVLSPEGFLSVQTTIRPNHSVGFAYLLERFIRFGFFDENELRELIRLHGFAFIQSERHHISFTFLAQKASQ